jgi:aspartyl protease
MSLRFPYKRGKASHPLVSLQGRLDRPRPVIPLCLIGPANTWVGNGLLDTGADDTVFPESTALQIGLDLTQAPSGTGMGVAGNPTALRYAEVTLRLVAQQEQREWRAWVGFAAAPLRLPLLGYAGFLQFFDALFRGAHEEVERTVNALYPGT